MTPKPEGHMASHIRRRKFLATLGGAAAAWPLAAGAKQPAGSARIGFLRASAPPDHTMAALRRGLAEHGYLEGKNFTLVPSFGDGNLDRLAELAEALVAARVDLILADGTVTARAARAATTRSEEHTSELQSLRHLV